MSGSTIGTLYKTTTWGESHGKAIGAVIDGCPAGLSLSEEDIQPYLDRRKPGQSRYTTKRNEDDLVQILSGVFEGKTTGTPISLMIRNSDQHSRDYADLKDVYRPGHADYGYDAKYGFRDYRGGGRSSGRETAARVMSGAVACKILSALGVSLLTWTESIGSVKISSFDPEQISLNPFCMPDAKAAGDAAALIETCMRNHDSAGGVLVCRISGFPAGAGDPVFDKLDAQLAKAVFSIGAVKGVEIGDGFSAASSYGSINNDPFCSVQDQMSDEADGILHRTDSAGQDSSSHSFRSSIRTASNHAGGILGGISTGNDILIRAAVKPTPSIAQTQRTVNKNGEEVSLSIHGRHDPVIVPRAAVVLESMAAVVLVATLLTGMRARMENLKAIYL
ncbi:MAG: chorismate synthase [Eubacterium sp.]|nr:chorismate synthase [Eubacterium sp.]